ncbi:MAG: translation initiation factor IF-2 [Deltaproteobacteria bacterium]|nr:translation initiation factor IF-2 [Deltaproteobacteria bacterium]
MGKKRVHEIAKELGFQNRDLIEKLQKLGWDVKSHSSTVDEDDVRRALRKEEDERRARTDEQRVSIGVIRRRPKDEAAPPARVVRRAGDGAAAATEERPAKPTTVLRRARHEEPAPTEEEIAAAGEVEIEASRPAGGALEGAEPEAPAVETSMEAPVKAETPVEVAAHAAAEVEAAAAAAAEGAPAAEPTAPAGEDDEEKRERREARPARVEAKRRDEEEDEEDDKAHLELEELGLSEHDFAAMSAERVPDRVGARVAPPPPSSKPVTMPKEEEPQARVVRTIDPDVLKARLSGAKRPEPPKDWGRPSDIPASPVTELVVRTDASGKRRELVDVRKEAAKGKAGKLGQRRREEMSAKDLLEHRRGQVYYPTPSRKRVRTKGRPVPGRRDLPATGKKPIELGEAITIADLAHQMGRKATEIIGHLMREGVMATINQPITAEVAQSVAESFGYEVTSKAFDEESLLEGAPEAEVTADDPDAVLRPPVVTVMGHVDHGKTTLLDRIRSTNVAAGEAGGITQAIAGYQVKTSKGMVTFLDTPGHAAFTQMRARGANITDMVVLVVAADDGVMPQTLEAIQHAKSADVPIVVAVNKIDKPEANPERVLQQLAQHNILVEAYGGDVLCRQISARTGAGVEDLLEQVALQAEIMELRANPTLPARGTVIEAEIHKGRGPVATVLVQEGTLRIGDEVVVGEAIGRIRALIADGGRRVKEAGPSVPVQILGLDGVPNPGDELRVATSLDAAREIAAYRRETRRAAEQTGHARVSLQDLFSRLGEGSQKELKIIVKGDVQGSVEALRDALTQISAARVKVTVIASSVGAVTESDVEFAKASEAIIVGFGVRPDTNALKAARAMGVDIRTHSIIYEAVNEVRLAMEGLLAPVEKEQYLGRAEVRQTFNVPKVGTVAGCMVVDGSIARSAQIRLLRDSKPIYEGKLASLKRFKDDVREVKEGFECGMGIEKFNDIKAGDIIEAFEIVQVKAALDDGGSAATPAKSEARP